VKSVSVSVGNSIPHVLLQMFGHHHHSVLEIGSILCRQMTIFHSQRTRAVHRKSVNQSKPYSAARGVKGGERGVRWPKCEAAVCRDWQQAGPRRRRGARLLVGRSERSGDTIHAARKWVDRIPRTTLYVDNLSATCTADDLRSFVGNLGANVVSCYQVMPRHRRGRDPDQSRSAFRMCVASSDMEKVLDPTAWPDCITISEWFYIDPAEHSTRRRNVATTTVRQTSQPSSTLIVRRRRRYRMSRMIWSQPLSTPTLATKPASNQT